MPDQHGRLVSQAAAAQDYLDKCRKILAAPGWCSSAECDVETSARQQRLPTKGHVGARPERSGGIWKEHGAIRRVVELEHLAPEAFVEAAEFLYPDLRWRCELRGQDWPCHCRDVRVALEPADGRHDPERMDRDVVVREEHDLGAGFRQPAVASTRRARTRHRQAADVGPVAKALLDATGRRVRARPVVNDEDLQVPISRRTNGIDTGRDLIGPDFCGNHDGNRRSGLSEPDRLCLAEPPYDADRSVASSLLSQVISQLRS